MLGACYTLLILLGIKIVWLFAQPFVITLACLPGNLAYLGLKKSRVGFISGFILTLIGQSYIFATISSGTVAVANRMIQAHDGWGLIVWPIAFIGTYIIIATGSRDVQQAEKDNPELEKHPMYLSFWNAATLGIVMFVVFAVYPKAHVPLWFWLPWLES